MAVAAKDGLAGRGMASGPLSARSRFHNAQNAYSQDFLKLVDRRIDTYVTPNDTIIKDVRQTLLQVREQYDTVHHEAEQKEARLRVIREDIRACDDVQYRKTEQGQALDSMCKELERQYDEKMRDIKETQTSRKVYEHMLARIQREQAILRQKMLRMEEHLGRKKREAQQHAVGSEKARADRVQRSKELEHMELDAEAERTAAARAMDAMKMEIARREQTNHQRQKFEAWRQEVALEAANEAFNASAGRLRKLYAIEKLAQNCLQKITYEQVERSQKTEDGFQKIRDVTGLADVMDIVHKFLNRGVEYEQLHVSVREAEARLNTLRLDFDAFKQKTEGMTFELRGDAMGEIYKDVEQHERGLTEALEEHERCRLRLQRTTLQVEHLRRWAARVGRMLTPMEEPVKVDGPVDFKPFFMRLDDTCRKFVAHVSQQLQRRQLARKDLVKVAKHEYKEQARLLTDKEFMKVNCRVPAAADERRMSRQGASEDDPAASFTEERERCKHDSHEVSRRAQAEQHKKRPKV